MNKFFLNLGNQPLANNFLTKFNINQVKYNLKLYFNTKTKLVSISKRVPSNQMFNNKYPYRSSMSHTMRKSFKKLALKIKKKFNPNLLLEIGSNDGVLIQNFKKKNVIGIEPCKNLAIITKKKGFDTYDKYWDFQLAKILKEKHGEVDLIYAANTLTHISNLNEVFKSITYLLSKKGVLIIEDPSLMECIKKNSYDQFYNEHIYLFSAISVSYLLKKFNLEIFDIENLDTHGGSLRYYIKMKENNKIKISKRVNKQINKEYLFGLSKFSTYNKFSKNVIKSKKELLKILEKLKKDKKTVIGYGATAKAVTIINYCNINSDLISFFVDVTPEKINRYMPGKEIKIIEYKKNILENFNYAFLGAWNFRKEILKKEKKYLNRNIKFLTHVPFPHILK